MSFLFKTPAKRLQHVLIELDITPLQFSKDLGYKRPDSVYNIINERTKISVNFLSKVEKSVHPINTRWLETGFGDPLHIKLKKGGYGREISLDGKIIYPGELSFYYIKKLALNLAKVIDIEESSYSVEARVCNRSGLEFKFTTFSIEYDFIYDKKLHSILINPDWTVISYFDFWRIDQKSIRCQDLLNLYQNIGNSFENAVAEIQNEILELVEDLETNFEMEEKFLFESDAFKTLYTTDARKIELSHSLRNSLIARILVEKLNSFTISDYQKAIQEEFKPARDSNFVEVELDISRYNEDIIADSIKELYNAKTWEFNTSKKGGDIHININHYRILNNTAILILSKETLKHLWYSYAKSNHS